MFQDNLTFRHQLQISKNRYQLVGLVSWGWKEDDDALCNNRTGVNIDIACKYLFTFVEIADDVR